MSSIINYVADGSTSTFQIPFNFIDRAHVVVTVDGTTITPTFINDTQLSISPTPTSGLKITVKRQTPTGALVDFTDGSTLFEADLDLAHKQNRFIAEESSDRADSAIDTLNANITNINTVATDTAAINTVSGSITNVNSVATNMAEVLLADTNAATATTKASEASASATASEASKVISVTKAGEASASAASALASKNAASTSETNAAGSAATATTQANLATTNGATQVALATNQVSLATDQANLATTNGAAQVTLATTQTSLATTQASNAAGSASTASTQAGIATTKASEASASASAAAASAASITDEETNAAASAAASASSATASANSAAAAAAALDNFDDRYLGPKSSEPTVDNDGDALVSGALYFSTISNAMQVYDGANWIAASAAGVSSLNLYEYTATAGQTTFTGADDNNNSISFIQGNEIVVLNGIILDPSDYNSTSGTSIVLGVGAAVGDLLNVYAFKSFTVADTVAASTGGTFGGDVTVTGTLAATTLTGDGSAITGLPAGYTDTDVATYLAGVGNVVVGGTVDGVDIAARDATLTSTTTTANAALPKAGGTMTGVIAGFESTGIDDNATSTAITIDASENVGIGTDSPSFKQHTVINGATGDIAGFGLTGNANDPVLLIKGDASNQTLTFRAGSSTGTYPAIAFDMGTTGEAMRLDASGNLLVGKTDTTFNDDGIRLDPDGRVISTNTSNNALILNRTGTDGSIASFNKNGSTVGSIGNAGGDVYLRKSSGAGVYCSSTAVLPFGAHSLGQPSDRWSDLYLSGTANAANFNTTSDATLKTNVETLTGSLDKVKALRGVSYDWIESGGSEIGVIAQEVEAVIPDVVSTNDEGIKSVKYGNMVAVLIEAIKEQQAQIDELKAQLNS